MALPVISSEKEYSKSLSVSNVKTLGHEKLYVYCLSIGIELDRMAEKLCRFGGREYCLGKDLEPYDGAELDPDSDFDFDPDEIKPQHTITDCQRKQRPPVYWWD